MTIAAKNLEQYYSGSVEDTLSTAEKLYAAYGLRLLQKTDIVFHLDRLLQVNAALNEQMLIMKMGERCAACAATAKGGCCSSYMAANTDAILLLINLLMKIKVARQHNNAVDCCYLGLHGCSLQIKPIFCLNYNCIHILHAATASEMKQLEKRVASLLNEQTTLETRILEELAARPYLA